MSDAERTGRQSRERLDWGNESRPAGPTERNVEDEHESADVDSGRRDDGADDARDPDTDPKAELCSVEDPTCDACQ